MQEEFFGYDSIEKLVDICDKYDSENVFLVTGKKSFKLSGAEEKILANFKDKKFT